jgi:hypothetical protein
MTTEPKTTIDLSRFSAHELASYHAGLGIIAARKKGKQSPTTPRCFSVLGDVLAPTTRPNTPAVKRFSAKGPTLHRFSFHSGLFGA